MILSQRNIRHIKNGKLPKEGKGYHFAPLHDYYGTVKWLELRDKVFRRDECECVHCGSPYNLQAHHVRYPQYYFKGKDKYINIEADSLDNLITLCDECHSEVHQYRLRVNRDDKYRTYLYDEERPEDEIDFKALTFPPVHFSEDEEWIRWQERPWVRPGYPLKDLGEPEYPPIHLCGLLGF